MFIRGFSYGYNARRGDYRTPEADLSMQRMAALGGDWAALAFAVMQDSWHSTAIRPDYRFTVTDLDLISAVRSLHKAASDLRSRRHSYRYFCRCSFIAANVASLM